MKFREARISTKMTITFSLVILMLLVLTTLSLINMGKMYEANRVVGYNSVPSLNALSEIKEHIGRIHIGEIKAAFGLHPVENTVFNSSFKAIQQSTSLYRELIDSDEERQMFMEVQHSLDDWQQLHTHLMALINQGARQEAIQLMDTQAHQHFENLDQQIDCLTQYLDRDTEEAIADTLSAYTTGRHLLLGGSLVTIMLCIAASIIITRNIVAALKEVIVIAQHIAQGNLTQHVRQGGNSETGQLLNAIAGMQQALIQTIKQIRENATLVSTNSHDIAQGCANIASRTEQQAASLEQTSSAMEELSATVRQNADNAHAGGQVAEDTTNKAQQGHEIINDLVKRVQVIESGSQKIIDVIALIDNVAFQTNLLALNASVEAARAGEQGRGFAVVAGEVRKLAQQCANASKEIGGLIRSNVESVGEGVSLAHQANHSMDTIVTAIQRMAQLSHEISTASQEQRDGVAQIEVAINELDQATQQNVQLVEQSASSANALHQQSVSMEQTVARFRLEHDAQDKKHTK